MKNIVVNHGFTERFPAEILTEAGANVFYFPDKKFSFEIKKNTEGQPFIYINGKLVIKNGKAALPQLARIDNKNEKAQFAYLITSDKSIAVDEIDLFIPIFRTATFDDNLKLLKFIKFYDIPTLETSKAAEICMQKVKTYETLKQAGISVPEAISVSNKNQKKAIKEAMAFYIKKSRKVILKSNINAQGRGIYTPNSPEDLVEQLEALLEHHESVLVQEKINVGKELYHIRVAMCFNEIIASQKFIAQDHYLTSHVSNAKDVQDITLTPEQMQTCINASNIIGFNFGSLDCVLSTDGKFYILEVNILPRIRKKFPEQPEIMMKKLVEKYL